MDCPVTASWQGFPSETERENQGGTQCYDRQNGGIYNTRYEEKNETGRKASLFSKTYKGRQKNSFCYVSLCTSSFRFTYCFANNPFDLDVVRFLVGLDDHVIDHLEIIDRSSQTEDNRGRQDRQTGSRRWRERREKEKQKEKTCLDLGTGIDIGSRVITLVKYAHCWPCGFHPKTGPAEGSIRLWRRELSALLEVKHP